MRWAARSATAPACSWAARQPPKRCWRKPCGLSRKPNAPTAPSTAISLRPCSPAARGWDTVDCGLFWRRGMQAPYAPFSLREIVGNGRKSRFPSVRSGITERWCDFLPLASPDKVVEPCALGKRVVVEGGSTRRVMVFLTIARHAYLATPMAIWAVRSARFIRLRHAICLAPIARSAACSFRPRPTWS